MLESTKASNIGDCLVYTKEYIDTLRVSSIEKSHLNEKLTTILEHDDMFLRAKIAELLEEVSK